MLLRGQQSREDRRIDDDARLLQRAVASALNDASATLIVSEALPANVPTLSGAALAMLAAILAVVALAASRRR